MGTSKGSRDARYKVRSLAVRRSGVDGGMYLNMCVRCFVVIIWWLKMFNQFIFDVANVGRSLAFIGRDGFY